MPASAQTFRDLHHQPSVLRLPNAWDAGSARLFESVGAKAIARTTGLRAVNARTDGEALAAHVWAIARGEVPHG